MHTTTTDIRVGTGGEMSMGNMMIRFSYGGGEVSVVDSVWCNDHRAHMSWLNLIINLKKLLKSWRRSGQPAQSGDTHCTWTLKIQAASHTLWRVLVDLRGSGCRNVWYCCVQYTYTPLIQVTPQNNKNIVNWLTV